MDALQTINAHRTIRNYKSDPISDDILNSILDSATRASTTGNMQVYSIIVTTDETLKQELLPLHFGQQMVVKAPVILTFCADFNRFNKWCKQNKANPGYDNFLSFFTAAIDALLAAQNACLAAESYGLGICYLGTTTYMAEKIARVLDCPEAVVPVTTVVMGWPEETPPLTERLPLRAVLHHNKYKDFNQEEIDSIYFTRDNSAMTKALLNENQLETLAQIFVEKRYTKKDNIHFSKSYLEFIKKQGFFNQ